MLFGISDLAIYSLYVVGSIFIIASIHYGLISPSKESKFQERLYKNG